MLAMYKIEEIAAETVRPQIAGSGARTGDRTDPIRRKQFDQSVRWVRFVTLQRSVKTYEEEVCFVLGYN